jgi:ABC-type multidrug transport system ATPase subunit
MMDEFLIALTDVGVGVETSEGRIVSPLKPLSLSCGVGDQIGLIGRNGSGKTTLARLLSGLDRPSTGKIARRGRILLVPQRAEDQFIAPTVGQQVASYAPGRLGQDELDGILQAVGLPLELAARSPQRLSTGQQRLLAIAAALATNARFMILDEPMAGLDQDGRQLVTQALIHLKRSGSCGTLIISHHPDDLLGLVERLWILDDGRLVYDGPFRAAPIDLLDLCFSPDEASLYCRLRRWESQVGPLPDALYAGIDVAQMARLLLRNEN